MSTSRVGRKPITIPSGVEIKLQEDGLSIKGSKGQVVYSLHPSVTAEINNSTNHLTLISNNILTSFSNKRTNVFFQ